jgi:hypothetical protein
VTFGDGGYVVTADVAGGGFNGPSHVTFRVEGDRVARMTIRARPAADHRSARRSAKAIKSRRSIAAAINSGNASGVHANAGTPSAASAAAFSWS